VVAVTAMTGVGTVLVVAGVLVRLGVLAMLIGRQLIGGRAVVRSVAGVVVTCHLPTPHTQDG
jgi:hypothetical protein